MIKEQKTFITQLNEAEHYLPYFFKHFFDFSEFPSLHPLINQYFFGEKQNYSDLILSEIIWLLDGEKNKQPDLVDFFLISLQGLKNTIEYYQIESWKELKEIMDGEKKVFLEKIMQIS